MSKTSPNETLTEISVRLDRFSVDIFVKIFVFKNVSSTEAENPLLEIPAFAVIETIEDTGLQDCEKVKTKRNIKYLVFFSN